MTPWIVLLVGFVFVSLTWRYLWAFVIDVYFLVRYVRWTVRRLAALYRDEEYMELRRAAQRDLDAIGPSRGTQKV